jgi:hypothetical protein
MALDTAMVAMVSGINGWNKVWAAAKWVGKLQFADSYLGNRYELCVKADAAGKLLYSLAGARCGENRYSVPHATSNEFFQNMLPTHRVGRGVKATRAAVVRAMRYADNAKAAKWVD